MLHLGHALSVSALFSLFCIVARAQSTIQYVGVVRDFSQLHNDFEGITASDGPQQGMLLNQLNAVNRTVFMPPNLRSGSQITNLHCFGTGNTKISSTTMANWGQFYWDEHYLDVPGVNIAMPVVMTLTQNLTVDPSGYTYTIIDDWYHPINNLGYGAREALTLYAPNGNTACCENQGPAGISSVTGANMWFTTEFNIPFYYRGIGEKFAFYGDDDLYVFINGRLVQGCDLGGIHQRAACSFFLSNVTDTSGTAFGLQVNSTYSMLIYYAERHTAGSHLMITTSILPTNTPPTAYNTIVTLNKASAASFTPRASDPDGNLLQYKVLTLPASGNLTVYDSVSRTNSYVVANRFYNLTTTTLTYTPIGLFVGQDSCTFLASDFISNSNVATFTFNVAQKNIPPLAVSTSVNIFSNVISYIPLQATDMDQANTNNFQYAVSGTSACSLGGCTLPCVRNIDVTGNGIGDCISGQVAASNSSQASFLKYVPVNLGTDTLRFIVNDGTDWSNNIGEVTLTITCDPSVSKCTSAGDSTGQDPRGNNSTLSGGTLAGVIAGAAVLASLLGGGIAYVVYFKVAAARFEKAV